MRCPALLVDGSVIVVGSDMGHVLEEVIDLLRVAVCARSEAEVSAPARYINACGAIVEDKPCKFLPVLWS